MRLTFFGAAQEVTGSLLLLETERGSLIVDCGLFQGRRAESRQRNRILPEAAINAGAAILTHAHIDHSGNLPTLVKAGFSGSIYATPASIDLCSAMLQDSARIQAADARYLNHKLADDPTWETLNPLYDEADVTLALGSFRSMPYHRLFHPLPGVTAQFLNAGHILGSAQVVLDVDHQGTRRRVVISGDLGRQGLPIIRDPERPPAPIDYVVMESTYGNRVHGSLSQMEGDLERIVNDSVRRKGKIIVPAFAVGRTQELLYVLHGLLRSKRIPGLPVFIDSPLAIDVTETFRRHGECFDEQTREFLRKHGDVFSFEGVRFTRTTEESMQINQHEGPAIIISASGMAEGGRVLHHLRNHVSNENSTILIIGYMAQQTLGRRLVERRKRVKIWGVERELVARVEVLDSFSAHADRNDLIRYATGCGPLRELFLVHGEPDQQEPLRRVLTEQGIPCRIPRRCEAIELH